MILYGDIHERLLNICPPLPSGFGKHTSEILLNICVSLPSSNLAEIHSNISEIDLP
jgi:hypothetical protein